MTKIAITNHALLRYLERVENFGVEGFRTAQGLPPDDDALLIERLASVLKFDIDGAKYEMAQTLQVLCKSVKDDGQDRKIEWRDVTFVFGGSRLVTVLDAGSGQRFERRHKKKLKRHLKRVERAFEKGKGNKMGAARWRDDYT